MAADDSTTFGELLRRYRSSARLTQEELAERAQLSRRAVQDLERGARRRPRRGTVELLADALRLDEPARRHLHAARRPPATDRAAVRNRRGLPVVLTTFVGREQQVDELSRLLGEQRLITLVGAGGVGKTRLALRVAGAVAMRFTGGVHVVELGALAEPALVVQAVAAALGLAEQQDLPLVRLIEETLEHEHALLVLDNCEHLGAACAELADGLLRACVKLRVLATSREPLNVQGETVWRVPSLSLPELTAAHSPDALLKSEAVQLFVERAGSAHAAFALSDQNALGVALVCWRLDGIPLAIELAAAWVSTLAPSEIAVRLDQPLRLLVKGSHGVPARQKTLRATIDWSYGLLAAHEQRLFDQLSVFAGGWTLAAAETVCGADGVEPVQILASLVEKSLVLAEPLADGSIRYRLLETLRQYAAERLQTRSEAILMRDRHLDWCLDLAQRAEPELRGADQRVWLDQLEREHDNLRAALEWATSTSGGLVSGLLLGSALWRFWYIRGHLSEGRRRLGQLLNRDTAGADLEQRREARAKALHASSLLAYSQRDYAFATALASESLALWAQLGDRRGVGNALNTQAMAAMDQGDLARSAELYRRSLAECRAVGDKLGVANALNNLAEVERFRGDIGRALPLYQDGLALMRELGDRWGVANLTCNLGEVALDRGELALSAALFEESLALRQDLGDKPGISIVESNLGDVARAQGDVARADGLYQHGLTLARELGEQRGIARSLTSLGEVAWLRGEVGRALALHQESLALRRQLGDRRGSAKELTRLGLIATALGDWGQAASDYAESLALLREVGDKRAIAQCLVGLAALAGARQQCERAARLFGAAEALRESIGVALPLADRADYETSVGKVRTALGEAAFGAAWAAGRQLSPDAAVEESVGS